MGVDFNQNIAESLKTLRKQRALSQAELAKVLDVSQPTLSLLEQGKNSLTAEQLVTLIQRYNLTLEDFLPKTKNNNEEAGLQNVLVRLGASHLREAQGVSPASYILSVNDVLIEILSSPQSSRFVTALAPVMVENINSIHLSSIYLKLCHINRECRLLWLLDILSSVLHHVLESHLNRELKSKYNHALKVIEAEFSILSQREKGSFIEDPFLYEHRSQKTRASAQLSRDKFAKRWYILTDLTAADFEKALLEAGKHD